MLNALAWIELHRNHLIAAAGILLLVIAGVYLWRHFDEARESRANAALLAIRPTPGELDSAPTAADYLKVAEEHAGSSAAARARLLAAGAFFTAGRYSEALTEFEALLADSDSDLVAAQAAFGAAAALDALDRIEQAIPRYHEVINRFPEESVASQARLALARIHESRQQPEAALRLYDEVLRDRDPGPFAQLAAQQREGLLRRHPELAGTNLPPVMVN
jgi:tetratricopeptide (TPR) repeat protein